MPNSISKRRHTFGARRIGVVQRRVGGQVNVIDRAIVRPPADSATSSRIWSARSALPCPAGGDHDDLGVLRLEQVSGERVAYPLCPAWHPRSSRRQSHD